MVVEWVVQGRVDEVVVDVLDFLNVSLVSREMRFSAG